MPPHCYWTKMRLWSLESGGSFQRSPYCVGGWRGPAGHCCPEERALSWTDGSIQCDCPPQWWKTVPLLIPFAMAGELRGREGLGQVWGSSWGAWRKGQSPERCGACKRHVHLLTQGCSAAFMHDPPISFSLYCPEHKGMSYILHFLPVAEG